MNHSTHLRSGGGRYYNWSEVPLSLSSVTILSHHKMSPQFYFPFTFGTKYPKRQLYFLSCQLSKGEAAEMTWDGISVIPSFLHFVNLTYISNIKSNPWQVYCNSEKRKPYELMSLSFAFFGEIITDCFELAAVGMKMVADVEEFTGVNESCIRLAVSQRKDEINYKLQESCRLQVCQHRKVHEWSSPPTMNLSLYLVYYYAVCVSCVLDRRWFTISEIYYISDKCSLQMWICAALTKWQRLSASSVVRTASHILG